MKSCLPVLLTLLLLLSCRQAEKPEQPPAELAPDLRPLPERNAALATVLQRQGGLGPAGTARPRDVTLENRRALFAISALERRPGLFTGGGCIVDATPAARRTDTLKAVALCFEQELSRQPDWQTMEIASAGGKDSEASVRLVGRYGRHQPIRLTYLLPPDDSALQIIAEVTNEDTRPVRLAPGLAVFTGRTRRFAPPLGFDIIYQNSQILYLGWSDGTTSYGLMDEKGTPWHSRHEPGLSLIRAGRRTIPPGKTARWRWFLYVVDEPISGIADRYWPIAKLPTGDAQFQFIEPENAVPVPGMTVLLRDGRGAVLTTARSGEDGIAACRMPAGQMLLTFRAPGRPAIRPFRVTAVVGKTHKAAFSVGKPAAAVCRVFEKSPAGEQRPVSARLMLRSIDRFTPQPELGPAWSLEGSGPVVIARDGVARVPLSPGPGTRGRYTITAFRGPAHSAVTREVRVDPGDQVEVELTLERLYETAPYVGVDPAQFTDVNLRGLLSPVERRIVNDADGLDGVVYLLSDMRRGGPAGDRRLSGAAWATGLDLWLPGLGRTACWPIKESRPADELLATLETAAELPDPAALVKSRLGQGAVIEAIAAADTDESYFILNGFKGAPEGLPPAGITCPLDAVEILRGRNLLATRRTLEHWFRLLNAGYRTRIVGGSGSRGVLWDEGGYPRTYVAVADATESTVVSKAAQAVIRTGDAFVSTGPFIRLVANGKSGFGSLVAAPGGKLTLDLEVLAAPRMSVSVLRIYANGEEIKKIQVPSSNRETVRLKERLELTLPSDAWLVIEVKGYRGMQTTHLGSGLSALLPYAITNPVWCDVDGDGRFTSPLMRAERK